MIYAEYPNCTKTFVVVHYAGFGVQESPYQEEGVVFESDDMNVAQLEAQQLTEKNNKPNCGSWKFNTYWVNVNVLTEEGKRLEKLFEQKFNERMKQVPSSNIFKL